MSDVEDLEQLLDQLHAALTSADFVAIGGLAPKLDAALSRLDTLGDATALQRLRRKADRNADCAKAAERGVRAALRRLAEVRQAATGLLTYDPQGRRQTCFGPSGVTRRF